jgi:hypothetical protein
VWKSVGVVGSRLVVVGVEGGRWRAFESIVVGGCSAGTDDGAIAEPASTDDPRSGVELGSRVRGV